MPMPCHLSLMDVCLKDGQLHLQYERSCEQKGKVPDFLFSPLPRNCNTTVPWKLWSILDLSCTEIKFVLDHYYPDKTRNSC